MAKTLAMVAVTLLGLVIVSVVALLELATVVMPLLDWGLGVGMLLLWVFLCPVVFIHAVSRRTWEGVLWWLGCGLFGVYWVGVYGVTYQVMQLNRWAATGLGLLVVYGPVLLLKRCLDRKDRAAY